ncbi:hypothetical protein [Saccharolobus islandicus]|uniref:hypothetical protein n=1 Tax=Saccharolobus islandicus TaxID=43080 RepID=UPI000371F326|nr:hypothetical protein [Sulfolobus islandicus]
MVRYLHFISEGEIRDQWYAEIVEYLKRRGIDSINIPEMLVGNQRADLVTYICNNGYCSPLFLFEFKNELKSSSHTKICQQAFNYASIINPYYTVCVDLTNFIRLEIYHGNTQIFSSSFQSYGELFNYFFSVFLPQALSVTLNFTIPRSAVINKIFASPTYERFLRAEFVRILNKNGFCAISECSSINLEGLGIVKPDLAIYTTSCDNEQLLDCEYPFLVLEFKSYYDKTASSQVQKYKDSLLPYYYGVVYGMSNSAKIEINDNKNSKILSESIPIGNPYLNDNIVMNLINKLPKVSLPKTPLNGRYHISQLVKMGAKVSRFTPSLKMRYIIPEFSVYLDRGGVKYPNHDYSIIIDCPAKLTRLVFFDPNNTLQWCEFQNGRLVRCNIDVIAVMTSSPCSRLIDKIYP